MFTKQSIWLIIFISLFVLATGLFIVSINFNATGFLGLPDWMLAYVILQLFIPLSLLFFIKYYWKK